jgi:hypothetical protein
VQSQYVDELHLDEIEPHFEEVENTIVIDLNNEVISAHAQKSWSSTQPTLIE